MRIHIEIDEHEPKGIVIPDVDSEAEKLVLNAIDLEQARNQLQAIGIACARASADIQSEIDGRAARPHSMVGMMDLEPSERVDAVTGRKLPPVKE